MSSLTPQQVSNAVALVLLIGVLFGMCAEFGGGCVDVGNVEIPRI